MSTSPSGLLPTDPFSIRLRELSNHPGAVKATSTIDRTDVYGNFETWTVTTYRAEGQETVFLQRIDASATPLRVVLPPEVTDALSRQRGRAITVNRRRGARKAVETKLAEGQRVGNPEALRKARSKRRARKARQD